MPLITPIFGLPYSAVDRLTESDDKNRGREKKQKDPDNRQNKAQSELSEQSSEVQSSTNISEIENSQSLDTETIVKLLDIQAKPQNLSENQIAPASDVYEHVKKITASPKISRVI